MKDIQALVANFLEAYLKGTAVERLKIQVTRDTEFEPLTRDLLSVEAKAALLDLFGAKELDLTLVDQLDQWVDAHEDLMDPAREYLFDLGMLHLIIQASEVHGEDFLDSDEWVTLEEDSLDRGTELLNLLIYLRDCRENEIDPNLEDFLNDFLLVSDDQFQDEFFIYEDLIMQQALIEGKDEAIFEAGKSLKSEEIEEVFIPFLLFFKNLEVSSPATFVRILNLSPDRAITAGLYQLLQQFYMAEGVKGN